MKKFSLILICFALFISACGSSGNSRGTPGNPRAVGKQGGSKNWIKNPKAFYPDSEYLSAVGDGDTLSDAQSRASSQLASIFKVRIKSELNVNSRYEQLVKNGVVTSKSESEGSSENIRHSTDQTLTNIQYGDSYTDETGRVYVIAFMNRRKTAGIYKDKIMDNAQSVAAFMENSTEESALLKKYAFLNAAYVIAQHNHKFISQLAIIHPPTKKSLSLPYNLDDLRKNLTKTAEEMPFAITVENDRDDKLKNIISDALSNYGFIISENNKLTVNATIKLEKTDLENKYYNMRWFINLSVTDESGDILISHEDNKRVSAISKTEAISRCFNSMEKVIDKHLIGSFNTYLNNFLKK